uniref:Cadherin domain-containing protein n=1 Tax=Anopheles maculatus TaxID=74869 RepID=A0A182SHC2_9DIPT
MALESNRPSSGALNQDASKDINAWNPVSATDPDCGVNAMVNYTLGEGYKKNTEFEIRPSTGEVCIASELDYETRNSYEFPIIATDRGGLSTTAMVKIQLTDVNDNRPTFYPREYNVSLRESMPTNSLLSTPVVVVVATDSDSGSFGTISYRIVAGNEAGIFRMDRLTGEIFVTRPNMLSSRTQPYHRLNISASDGGGLRSTHDAEVFISVIDATQRPPIFDKPRYTYYVKEDVKRNTVVGTVSATSSNSGNRGSLRYFIYSGDPDGFFAIDPVSGNIRVANALDHETKPQVLLNIQATSGDPPAYGHTQVNIDIEDVNDNPPEFESSTVRISVPENVEIGSPLYEANAQDKDSGMSGVITYMLAGQGNPLSGARSSLFSMDSRSGHLTLARPLDYESMQRHTLVVTASDSGTPSLSTNLTILVEVQDVNDNAPIFERNEYAITVIESTPSNSQILQVSATDADTGNNARLTYKILGEDHQRTGKSTQPASPDERVAEIFGIFPNSGWIYLRTKLDREVKERYNITVIVSDNGVPTLTATAHVIVTILDANDNSPIFAKNLYEFEIEENMRRGAMIGTVSASDYDAGINAVVRYSLIPSNTSFQINPVSGEITTRDSLDRETKASYDLVVEARDQGTPYRSSRVSVQIQILDVNDNAPDIVDPQEDVVSVREEQPIGTEVVKVRAIDRDHGQNASISYSILKGRDSDGYGMFSIDPMSGVIRTKTSLDHEEKTIYRLAVAATDNGKPPKQTVRLLRIEVLDLNDNRPTFTSSSLVFRLREDVGVGHIIGSISGNEQSDAENLISSSNDLHITYTLTPLTNDITEGAFDIDRNSGKLVVARQLDREQQSEYRMEIRALDTSASNNPQSSAVTVKIEIADVNDNPPKWPSDPINVYVSEDTPVGAIVYNFTVQDNDSGTNAEIKYNLSKPAHLAQKEYFAIDSLTGSLTLLAPLDHEDTQEFLLIVQATDQSSNVTERLTTSATARIMVTDVNDNSPKFVIPQTPDGVVYISDSLEIDQVVSHVVAIDSDSGENGHIAYTFVGGNEDERFTIDSSSGIIRLAKPFSSNFIMDSGKRNSVSGKYQLVISASDHGSPRPREAKITLQIVIQNMTNNPPRFVEPVYYVNITENVPSGSFVVRVSARSHSDAGSGGSLNLTYEIPKGVGEDHFAVDPVRGIVTTRGTFDRESKDLYTIPIYVTEGGRFKKASTASVSSQEMAQFDVATLVVRITDVNDHAPEFVQGSCYPLAVPENSELSVIHNVVATDADDGLNSEITYSISGGNMGNKFSIDLHTGALTARPLDREVHASDQGSNGEIVYSLNENANSIGKFRINPTTGALSATQSLASENGRLLHIEVTARDKGNPPQIATGLIELRVGEVQQELPVLRFQNSTYRVMLLENTPVGQPVLQLSAVRSDGRRQKIIYSFGSGNEEGTFSIDAVTGEIRIRNSHNLDYERFSRLKSEGIELVAVARTDGTPLLYGYTSIIVELRDENDNAPRFTQQQYAASVWEGNSKGTFVIKVGAFDSDQGANARILYHIVDGNHDNAFIIEPAFSGIVKTNIVLDREIRDKYKLKVIATDEGVPQMTGTATINVNVVDVNDNQPTFPPNTVISVSEDYEDRHEFLLRLLASDSAHVARTTLTVRVVDVNDNAPIFQQITYHAMLSDPTDGSNTNVMILSVNATDADSEPNAIVRYSIVSPKGTVTSGFTIDESTGQLFANISQLSTNGMGGTMYLTVAATDSGQPALSSTTTVRLEMKSKGKVNPQYVQSQYRVSVNEEALPGTTVVNLIPKSVLQQQSGAESAIAFEIIDGNEDSVFDVTYPDGAIVLVDRLDRERVDYYELKLVTVEPGTRHINRPDATLSTVVRVIVTVEDANDNAPEFQPGTYEATIGELVPIKHSIAKLSALDADQSGSPSSEVIYQIISGNDSGMFSIDLVSGLLYTNKYLDYDHGQTQYNLVIRACDSHSAPRCAVHPFTIALSDENDNEPQFPVPEYLEFVGENEPIGISIFTARATDMDRGPFGIVNYTIDSVLSGSYSGLDDSWKLFKVDPTSGVVNSNAVFDYEEKNRYAFALRATDTGGKSKTVRVKIVIESRDEFSPQFTERTYRFVIKTPESGQLPVGYVVGHVTATDRDRGPDGRIVYQLTTQHPYFKMNRTTGAILIKKRLDNVATILDAGRDISLVVTAGSGRQGSLTNMTVVEIAIDALAHLKGNELGNSAGGSGSYENSQSVSAGGGFANWAVGLVISLVLIIICVGSVFLFLHMRNRQQKHVNKTGLSSESVGHSNNYVDPSAFDTIPIRGSSSGATGAGQFAPPKYDEIPPYGASSNSGAATTSELSGSEQSGSSGRGSAEDDGEDEEIRMINEGGPLQRDGLQLDGRLSDVSVQNTQEYLARLGIVDNGTTGNASNSSRRCSESMGLGSSKDAMLHTLPIDTLHMFHDDEHHRESDLTNLIYAKLNDVTNNSDRASSVDETVTNAGSIGATVDHVMMGGYGDVPVVGNQQGISMNGSLSSIVHSEEELTGSYNWDYLLDWGPQYQPLAHVFSEIARLKDDTLSVQSGNSGTSSAKSKNSLHHTVKTLPPPLLTNVAPRSINVPVFAGRNNPGSHHGGAPNQYLLPRSPISHDSAAGFSTSSAMSPSFSPSLSPLATRSPSISPHVVSTGMPTSHHMVSLPRPPQQRGPAGQRKPY